MHVIETILGSPDPFLDQIFKLLNQHGIEVSSFELDHICFRVEHIEDYRRLQAALLSHGQLLSDKLIGGRPISVIQMNQPYIYRNRNIDIIELPAPKAGRHYDEGYEHVEFVIADLSDFIQQYLSINFDLKGMDKSINKDIRIAWDDLSVKFHEQSLKYVIEVLER